MEMNKSGKLSVEAGKVSIEVGMSIDSDKDGKAAAEVAVVAKADLAEILDEVGQANDQASLVAIALFVEKYGANLPKVEKDIAL